MFILSWHVSRAHEVRYARPDLYSGPTRTCTCTLLKGLVLFRPDSACTRALEARLSILVRDLPTGLEGICPQRRYMESTTIKPLVNPRRTHGVIGEVGPISPCTKKIGCCQMTSVIGSPDAFYSCPQLDACSHVRPLEKESVGNKG